MEEAKEDKAPLALSLVVLLRFPRREDGYTEGEETGEEGEEQF